jgi:leader peptidase (prepilin peptidase) / N-methyltransferase
VLADIIIYMIGIFVFILGTIVGSFLNVVVLRYGSLIGSNQRSECFSCGQKLKFFDLFPIFSFLFLGGRCRYCKSKISIQYPLIELLTGLTFLFTYIKIGVLSLELFFFLIIWSIFIAIFVYDLKHKIIPNGLVYSLITLSLIKVLIISSPDFLSHLWLILAGPIASTPFAFLWLVSKGQWMGFGDAKIVLGMGWLLGLSGVISAITFAFWIGAIIGLLLIVLSKVNPIRRKPLQSEGDIARSRFFSNGAGLSRWPQRFKNLTIKSEIPFAPFLIIGTGIVFFLEYNLTGFLHI